MKTFVIDASVVLRFLLEEDHAVLVREVTKLLRAADKKTMLLFSTPLLPLEIANGLRFTLKDTSLAQEVQHKFFALPIEIVPLTPAQTQKALELSYESGMTVYDTSYHVLALARGVEFLTANKKYYMKSKYIGNISLIG